MPRFTIKLLVICFLSAFCIFFAVDMATKGTERINGPFIEEAKQTSSSLHDEIKQDTAAATATPVDNSTTVADSTAAVKSAVAAEEKDPTIGLKPIIKAKNTNHVPEKIGGLLQITADHSIKLVVSLFEGVFE